MWYDEKWFTDEWLPLARKSYQQYRPRLFYDIPQKDVPNNSSWIQKNPLFEKHHFFEKPEFPPISENFEADF